MEKVRDQLQYVSGELLATRVMLDSEWTEALTKKESRVNTLLAAQLLCQAQSAIDEARERLKEVTDGQ